MDLAEFRLDRLEPRIFGDAVIHVAHRRCIWHAELPAGTTLDELMRVVAEHAQLCTTQATRV